MKYIDIKNAATSLEELTLAKIDIESYQLAKGEIEEKSTLIDFISNMKLHDNIYMFDSMVFSFSIMVSADEQYLFYASNISDKGELDRCFESFTARVSEVDYDISKLTKKSSAEFLLEDMAQKSFFIIRNEFYV